MFLLLLLKLGGPVNRANKKRLLVFGSRINYLQVLVYDTFSFILLLKILCIFWVALSAFST